MKRLDCIFVWWPGITQDIEDKVKNCTECQKNCPPSPVAPLMPGNGLADLGLEFI